MLKVESIKKNYDNFSLDVNLEVKPGHITALIGPNGAGKSTTFKAILGLIKLDSGKVCMFNKNIESFTGQDKARLGVFLLDTGYNEFLTVKEIVKILSRLYENFDENAFCKDVEAFALPLNQKVSSFSNGMKAKLKLLIALANQPSFLLLDEPTNGLDVVAREEILTKIRNYMMKHEASILISSHLAKDLASICDDFYVILDGRILYYETMDNLEANYAKIAVKSDENIKLDKAYLIKKIRTDYGYCYLTNERSFYQENYREFVIEKVDLDDLLTFMIRGEDLC